MRRALRERGAGQGVPDGNPVSYSTRNGMFA
jgi:hypothetical protein